MFFLENADSTIANYRRLCVEKKITAVGELDKANLKAFLTGELDTCPQIDLAAAASFVMEPEKTQEIEMEVEDTTLRQISIEEMQEQRQRHAALIDQAIQRPPTLAISQAAT